jgi:hypothetical protein
MFHPLDTALAPPRINRKTSNGNGGSLKLKYYVISVPELGGVGVREDEGEDETDVIHGDDLIALVPAEAQLLVRDLQQLIERG